MPGRLFRCGGLPALGLDPDLQLRKARAALRLEAAALLGKGCAPTSIRTSRPLTLPIGPRQGETTGSGNPNCPGEINCQDRLLHCPLLADRARGVPVPRPIAAGSSHHGSCATGVAVALAPKAFSDNPGEPAPCCWRGADFQNRLLLPNFARHCPCSRPPSHRHSRAPAGRPLHMTGEYWPSGLSLGLGGCPFLSLRLDATPREPETNSDPHTKEGPVHHPGRLHLCRSSAMCLALPGGTDRTLKTATGTLLVARQPRWLRWSPDPAPIRLNAVAAVALGRLLGGSVEGSAVSVDFRWRPRKVERWLRVDPSPALGDQLLVHVAFRPQRGCSP